MANLNPFNLDGARVNAPFAPGYTRGTRVTAPNGHYIDFASDVTWGLFADGMPWFINDGVAITARFPAGRTYLGDAVDGYTLNPTLGGNQGLDERRPNYAAPAAINTITPRKMDVILSVESEETSTIGGGNEFRDGYFQTNGQAWFTCVTRPPSATTFSPTVYWPSDDVNRVLRPMREVDIDGLLSRLPSYSASGITSPPAWSTFANTLDQPNVAWLHNAYFVGGGVVGAGGYEGGFPRGFNGSLTQMNYGEYVADEVNRASMTAVLNTWSSADKRAFLVRMCQHGNQWLEPFDGLAARTILPDGGHYQWHWPAAAMWLDATGQNARSAALFGTFPGNYDQVFVVTASNVANDFVSHADGTKPFPWRRRLLSAVSFPTITLESKAEDYPFPIFTDLLMERVSDGDTSLHTAQGGTFYEYTTDTQASGVWTVGNEVFHKPRFTITEGMRLWTIKGPTQMAYFNPTKNANYLGLQSWAGQVLLLRSLGIVAPIFEDAADFVALCIAGNYPVAPPDAYPDLRKTTLETQVWNAHWSTASAVASRF